MTTIDFYTHVADRLTVTARLVAKAVAAHGSVRVLTPDAATTDALDRLLWTTPATGFVPHCRMDSKMAAVLRMAEQPIGKVRPRVADIRKCRVPDFISEEEVGNRTRSAILTRPHEQFSAVATQRNRMF